MEQKELQEKQQKAVELSLEIARLSKILSIKQRQFDKLDIEIYNAIKSMEHGQQQETSEGNK